MKLAITGTTGRVGRALADRLAGVHEVLELPRSVFDLAEEGLIEGLADFDVLLNPAAMTSLEGCEDEPELAHRVNGEAPREMAAWCRRVGRGFLQISTDYVLDGSEDGLHEEEARVDPKSVYAWSKREGELGVLDAGGCVMRVSWVFGPEKAAFPDQVIRSAMAGERLAAVADKTSLPTFSKDLAGWVECLLEGGLPEGLVHTCNSGEPVSWHGMAEEIVDALVERGALREKPRVEPQMLDEMMA